MIFVTGQLYDERVLIIEERRRADRTAHITRELLLRHSVQIRDELVWTSLQLGWRVIRFLHESLDERVHEIVVCLVVRGAGAAAHHLKGIREETEGR